MMAHLGLNTSAAPSSAAPSSLPPAAPSLPSAGPNLGSGSKRRRTITNDADADADANMTTTARDTNASNNSAAGNADAPAAATAPAAAVRSSRRNFFQSVSKAIPIKYGTKAKADTNPSDAGITLSGALAQMFERRLLHTGRPLSKFGGRDKSTVPFISGANQEKMNKCLLLVDMVWTTDQEAVLREKPETSNPTQDANVARVATEIQNAVMTRMVELEKEAVAAGSTKLQPAGNRAKPKITGVGGRYQKYLQAIKQLENQSE